MTSGRQALQRVLGICPGSPHLQARCFGQNAVLSSASQREEGRGILEVVLAQPGPQPGLVSVPLNEESGVQH